MFEQSNSQTLVNTRYVWTI